MTPRVPRDSESPVIIPSDPPAEQTFYCQRGIGYIHCTEKTVICESCYQSLPRMEKISWLKIFKHTLTVEGIIVGVNCEQCEAQLTIIRLGFNCVECTEKYELYLIDPELVQARYNQNQTITINVHIHIQAVDVYE